MDVITTTLIVIAGIATTMGLIVGGISYWYWTRRPVGNVVLFSLALFGIGAVISVAKIILSTALGPLAQILAMVASIYAWYYLLNKTKTFRTQENWIKILLTATIVNLILGMILIGWTLDVLNAGTIAQAIIPIGG